MHNVISGWKRGEFSKVVLGVRNFIYDFSEGDFADTKPKTFPHVSLWG
jgi:hypothetical protein